MNTNRALLQEKLFEIEPRFTQGSVGQRRVMCGLIAEEIVCAALQLDRIKINGQCEVNFDAEKDGMFYEIKSVALSSGKVVVYDWRIKKESKFENLTYIFFTHGKLGHASDIFSDMIATGGLVLCPGALVRELSKDFKLNIPKRRANDPPRYGYTRAGYIDGYYNIPIKSIGGTMESVSEIEFELYGKPRKIALRVIGGGGMKGHWSRSYSRRNTRLLRSLFKDGKIVADLERGIILNRKGKPYTVKENWCGYLRFRVAIKRRGKFINAWFFVHKAIFISQNQKLKAHHEINHINHNTKDNRRSNLEYIHRSLNRPRQVTPDPPPF